MFIATATFAECIPFFGVPGTVDGATYTVATAYVYKPGPYYYTAPPPPPRHHFHHHHHGPPPPPPPRHHGHHEPHHRPPRHPSPR